MLHKDKEPLVKKEMEHQAETRMPKGFPMMEHGSMPSITLETKKPAKVGSFPTTSKGVEK